MVTGAQRRPPAATGPLVIVGPFHPLRGGIAHFNARLARELACQGNEVRGVSFCRQYPRILFPGRTQLDPAPARPGDLAAEAIIDSVGPRTWRAAASFINRAAASGVIFAHWTPFLAPAYGTIARLVRRRSPAPRLLLCHNLAPHEPGVADRLLTRFLASACDGIVALSRTVEADAREMAPGVPVEYAPHPIVDAFADVPVPSRIEARQALGLSDEAVVLLFFGYVRHYKGLDIGINALAELRQRGCPAHLLVAGEFYDDRAKYEALIERLRLRDAVTMIDCYLPDEDVPPLFAAADACVLPYRSGSQSGVAKVAWRYGVPVVSSAAGGLAEDVVEGRTGFLFASEDVGGMADAVQRFLAARSNVDLAAAIREEQRRFGWRPLLSAIDHLLEHGR